MTDSNLKIFPTLEDQRKKELKEKLQELKDFYKNQNNEHLMNKVKKIDDSFNKMKEDYARIPQLHIDQLEREYYHGGIEALKEFTGKKLIKLEKELQRYLISLEEMKIQRIESLKS
ncbi:MAG: hypothetical protein QY321_01230 [Patescibacteria group bacterium]|nr:MAG: hypothetical protein QY321_01230 [Patescibacteria group bacterium]